MATYVYSNKKRRLNFARIMGAIAIVAVVIAIGLFIRLQNFDKKIETSQQKIETLTEQNKKTEEETVVIQEKIKALEEEALRLEELLWRYEPVVIPDSMNK